MRNQEHLLQVACVRWFRYQYPQYAPLLFAVPNGGKRDIVTAAKLKAEGALPGVADLILLVPKAQYHGLCIEMKYGKKGRQTEAQKEWQTSVEAQGYAYVVARSFEYFVSTVTTYLKR